MAHWLPLALDTLLSVGLARFIWQAWRDFASWIAVPVVAPPPADRAPRVAIMVPARNEERSIERCVRSLLAQYYPRDRFQVIATDDHSTDATGDILARLAAGDPRLTVDKSEPLPAGWLGKCWALQQAAQHAHPDTAFFVFTDADTVHQPEMLAAVVAHAERNQLDLLSLAPDQELGTLAERVLLPSILAIIMTANGTLGQVNDPARRDVAKAVGQFLLFRANTYWALGGHTPVRNEIVEDFAFARLVKGRGYRLQLADGRRLVRTRMYRSAREIWDGFTKNSSAEVGRRKFGAVEALVSLPLLAIGPYLACGVALARWRQARRRGWADHLFLLQGVAQTASVLWVGRMAARAWRLPDGYALGQPVSALCLWGIVLNSVWRTRSGRGVTWKGRVYTGESAPEPAAAAEPGPGAHISPD